MCIPKDAVRSQGPYANEEDMTMGKRTAALALVCAGILLCAGCEGRAGTEGSNDGASDFQTLLLVTAQNAEASVAENERMAAGGLLVEGDGASYTGTFNAVFEGNLEFSFGFCTGDPAAYRRFTFTFASAEDPGESFSVIYESTVGDWTGEESCRGRSGVYVKCGEALRTTRYWASDEAEAWQNNDNFDVDDALASPMFGGAGEKESEFGVQQGTLRLSWTADNVLEVYVSERFLEYSPRLIAAFDGSDAGLGFDPAFGLWGLPRMTFSEGYTVSFESEVFGGNVTEPNAPDVCFNEIVTGKRGQELTYPLSEEKIQQPPFYAAS